MKDEFHDEHAADAADAYSTRYRNLLKVGQYAVELTHHIASAGDGPDSYAYAVADELRQGIQAAIDGQEPHFTTVAFVGQRNDRRRAHARGYDEGYNDGLIYRTQRGEGEDY